ncbi:MAG: winged helix-turn-helix transcriptional regulator, partial [Thermoleophilia bacterium]|nr:winged helix-turn-helix transcriptional regulator [Thermoleophilia bacterium]
MSEVFDALGDPTRRHIVESLAQGEASATQLAAELPVTRQAVAKHLTAL